MVEVHRHPGQVEVVVPGPLIDQRWIRWVSRACWKPLLESGVRIYEFQPTNFHCKYMIVDDCWTSVGSTNLDARSLDLNEEANLNVLDRDFAQEHARVFESDKQQSIEVTLADWRRRSPRERMIAAAGSVLRGQM